MDWKSRMRNPLFWTGLASLIAMTGQVFGLYTVPEGWDTWVNAVLAVLTTLGVIVNPTTPGLKDGE